MRFGKFILLLAVAAAALPSAALPGLGKPDDVVDPLSAITPEGSRAKMEFLAGPSTEGRRAGTQGARMAAEYIASAFRAAGLEPGGDSGGWFQKVRVPRAYMPGQGNGMRIHGRNRVFELAYLSDFAPMGFSASASVKAPVVFAGYGVVDGKSGWNDYAGLDVRGKIVLVLRHGPRGAYEAHFSEGPGSENISMHAKARFAQQAGAAGMILVTDPARLESGERLAFMAGGGDTVGLPCVHATNRIGNALVGVSGKTLSGLQDLLDSSGQGARFEISGPEVGLDVRVSTGLDSCSNVVGFIRGSDASSGECVLIGAHFDHLGYGDIGAMGGKAGEIFPGADDNASGVVAMLEAALAFAKSPVRNRRSIVFVAFTGEEAGLLGSYAYANSPLFPLDKTVAMINLDMVGRVRNDKLTVMGVASGDTIEEIFRGANAVAGLDLTMAKDSYPGSDHQPFYVKKVPVAFLCSGTHPEYHKPSDKPDTINYDGLARVAKLCFAAATTLATQDDRPVFTGEGGDKPRHGGGRPRLGIMPDMAFEGAGARVASITDGMPAARAGIREGDVIVEIGGQKITDTGSLMSVLASIKPGTKIKLAYIRDGKRTEVEVDFGR